MKKMAEITSISDMLAYAQAEYADAQRYCTDTTTLGYYNQAVAGLQASSSITDSSSIDSVVAAAKNLITQARSAWYAAGCAKPGSSTAAASPSGGTSAASAPSDDEGTGGGSATSNASIWGPLLIAGVGLFAIWWLTKKKGGTSAAKQLPAARAVKRRPARRVTKHVARRR